MHSYSEVVLKTLLQAKSSNKRFTVYVTSGLDGKRMADCLKEADVKTILINQSAIGFYMERIDVILVGAESVCEDGGIINEVTAESLSLFQGFHVSECVNNPTASRSVTIEICVLSYQRLRLDS